MPNYISLRKLIEEMVEELEEMTATGNIEGFGTPYAFQGDKEANKEKRRKSAEASGFRVVEPIEDE